MTFGQLISNLNHEEKKLVRTIEKTEQKLNSCITAVAFNQVCLREGINPKNNNNNNIVGEPRAQNWAEPCNKRYTFLW